MTQAYVVIEGETDAQILKKLLTPAIINNVTFVVGSGLYSALSLATSLLAARQRPVAVVIDTDTTDSLASNERVQFFTEWLRQAAPNNRFRVFAAMPTIEIVLFHDKLTLEQIINRQLTDLEWEMAKHDPRAFLRDVMGANPQFMEQLLNNLTEDTLRSLREHPLIQAITAYLLTSMNGHYASAELTVFS